MISSFGRPTLLIAFLEFINKLESTINEIASYNEACHSDFVEENRDLIKNYYSLVSNYSADINSESRFSIISILEEELKKNNSIDELD